jgi:hypothetical protein
MVGETGNATIHSLATLGILEIARKALKMKEPTSISINMTDVLAVSKQSRSHHIRLYGKHLLRSYMRSTWSGRMYLIFGHSKAYKAPLWVCRLFLRTSTKPNLAMTAIRRDVINEDFIHQLQASLALFHVALT